MIINIKKVLKGNNLLFLKETFENAMVEMDGSLIEFERESDHVHLLIEYNTDISISKNVNNLKGRSSRFLRLIFEETKLGKHLWSRSYFASVGGALIEILKIYIQNQNTPQ